MNNSVRLFGASNTVFNISSGVLKRAVVRGVLRISGVLLYIVRGVPIRGVPIILGTGSCVLDIGVFRGVLTRRGVSCCVLKRPVVRGVLRRRGASCCCAKGVPTPHTRPAQIPLKTSNLRFRSASICLSTKQQAEVGKTVLPHFCLLPIGLCFRYFV